MAGRAALRIVSRPGVAEVDMPLETVQLRANWPKELAGQEKLADA